MDPYRSETSRLSPSSSSGSHQTPDRPDSPPSFFSRLQNELRKRAAAAPESPSSTSTHPTPAPSASRRVSLTGASRGHSDLLSVPFFASDPLDHDFTFHPDVSFLEADQQQELSCENLVASVRFLQRVFRSGDLLNRGFLTLEAFVQCLNPFNGPGAPLLWSEHELATLRRDLDSSGRLGEDSAWRQRIEGLYFRMDSNANGRIEWGEFLSYMFLETDNSESYSTDDNGPISASVSSRSMSISSSRQPPPPSAPTSLSTSVEDLRSLECVAVFGDGGIMATGNRSRGGRGRVSRRRRPEGAHTDMIRKVLYDSTRDEYITCSSSAVCAWEASFGLEFVRTLHRSRFPITDMVLVGQSGDYSSIHDGSSDNMNGIDSETKELYVADMGRRVCVFDMSAGLGGLTSMMDGSNSKARSVPTRLLRVFKGKLKALRVAETEHVMVPRELASSSSSSSSSSSDQSSNETGQRQSRRRRRRNRNRNSGMSRRKDNAMVKKSFRAHVLENLMDDPIAIDVYSGVLGGLDAPKRLLTVGCDTGYLKLYDVTPQYDIREEEIISTIKPLSTTREADRFGAWISSLVCDQARHSEFASSWDGLIRLFRLRGQLTHVRTFTPPVRKPIYSLAFSPPLNILASCGRSKVVNLWNPSVKIPIARLMGHRTPVLQVSFDSGNYRVVSLGSSKVIKIWDTRNFKCLQTIVEKTRMTPENQFSALIYNPPRDCIIACASKPWQYAQRRTFSPFDTVKYCGTGQPIVGVLSSATFGVVVAADKNGTILVFNYRSGQLIQRFDTHPSIVRISWDDTGRRMLVCLRNEIRAYNCLNGQHLVSFVAESRRADVTSAYSFVQHSDKKLRFLVVGRWDRRLAAHSDRQGDPTSAEVSSSACHDDVVIEPATQTFPTVLPAEITSLLYVPPTHLLAGLANGWLALLSADSGTYRRLQRGSSSATISSPTSGDRSTAFSSFDDSLRIEQMIAIERSTTPLLLTRRGSGLVSVWMVESLEHVVDLPHLDASCMALTHRRNVILGTHRGAILVFSLHSLVSSSVIRAIVPPPSARFRAHSAEVVSISFIPRVSGGFVVSGSSDCMVSIHTLDGIKVGYFGQRQLWNLADARTFGMVGARDLRKEGMGSRLGEEYLYDDDDLDDEEEVEGEGGAGLDETRK